VHVCAEVSGWDLHAGGWVCAASLLHSFPPPLPPTLATCTHCVRAMTRTARGSSQAMHPFAGANGDGRLGDGSTTDSSVPVAVSGGGTWLAVSTGGYYAIGHACGLKTGGALFCWGGLGSLHISRNVNFCV
jgi:hypothetical protein